MHFGKTLEARRSPRFARGYLEYDYLKRTLKVIVADPSKLSSFVSLLESEISRVDRFAAARVEDAKVAVSQLSRHVGGLSPSRASVEDIHAAEGQAAEVSAMLVDLHDFLALNRTAVSKLVKKHDKMTGFTTRAWVMARLDASGFLAHSLDGFLVALSDIYARLRLLREPQAEDGGGVWNPPESFQRETTKYWIRADDVYRLKMALLRHLPLLVFGRDTSRYKAITPLERDRITYEVSDGWITSVYLDNDAHDCYHTRLARSEGASITRIRWYGADAVPPPKAVVFVERKTHHDKAVTDEASVKERFPLRCGKVADLLGGGLDVPAYAALQVASGDMTEKQAANLTRLATEVAADVGARRLHACVRTVYKRAAFQLATRNDVRISLDTDMRLVDEVVGGTPIAGVGGAPFAPGRFCCDAAQLARPGAGVDFPYAILEIKLQGEETPEWLLQVLGTGIAVPVKKFSKVLTATRMLHPAAVTTTPHWMTPEGALIEPLDAAAVGAEALRVAGVEPDAIPDAVAASVAAMAFLFDPAGTARANAGGYSGANSAPVTPRAGSGSNSGKASPALASLSTSSTSATSLPALALTAGGSGDAVASSRAVRVQTAAASAGDTAPVVNPLHAAAAGKAPAAPPPLPLPPPPIAPAPAGSAVVAVPNALRAAAAANGAAIGSSAVVGEWRSSSASPAGKALATLRRLTGFEPPPPPPPSAPGVGPTAGQSLYPRKGGGGGGSGGKGGGNVRVEPKTFFANERTLLAWLQISLLITTIALGLLGVGTPEAKNVGYSLAPVAVIFLLYATFQYYRRVYNIEHRKADGYHDLWGPGFLVGLVLIAIIANVGIAAKGGSGTATGRRMLRAQLSASGQVLPQLQLQLAGSPGLLVSSRPALGLVASTDARCALLAAAPDVATAQGGRTLLALPPLVAPAAVSASAGGRGTIVSGAYGFAHLAPPTEGGAASAPVARWVTLGGLKLAAALPHPAAPASQLLAFASAPHPALVPVDAATGAPAGDRVPLDGVLGGQSLTGAAWAPESSSATGGTHTLLLATPGGIIVADVDPASLAVTATARAAVVPHLLPVVPATAAGGGDAAVTAVAAGAGRVWALLSYGTQHQGRRQEVRAYRWPSWELAAAWDAPAGGDGDGSSAWTGLAVAPGGDVADNGQLLLASAHGGAVWSLPLPAESASVATAPLVPAACVHHEFTAPTA